MARATVSIEKSWFSAKPGHRRRAMWVVVYRLYDAKGRLVCSDNACGRWADFMARAEREVGALNVIEQMGHTLKHDWDELVDRASGF